MHAGRFYMKLNAMNLAQARESLESGKITAAELTEACLAQAGAAEPQLNTLVTVCSEEARRQAERADEDRKAGKTGRLLGIPVIVKDNICTKDVLSTAASRMLSNYVPVYDAHVVERLRQEGAVIIGKANMDEFAMGSSTETSYYGVAKNPWNPACVSGGSSGGSAAAVAADEGIFALGSDTGGSVRQPAAFCGVVGLKPTYGTVSRYGLMAFASSLDQIGPLTKSVEDAAEVLDIIAGHDPRDSTSAVMTYPKYGEGMKESIGGLRVGLPKEYLAQQMDPEVRASYEKSADLLRSLGAEIVETSLPTFDYALSAYYIIASAEAASNLSRYDGIRYGYRAGEYDGYKDMYKETRTEGFGSEVKRRIMLGNYVLSAGYYDAYYLKALKVKTLIRQDFDRVFSSCDVLLSPSAPTPAFRIGAKATPLEMYVNDLFTVPVNIAGICAVSLPTSLTRDGLPLSVQFIAGAFQENTLLRAAWNLEQALGFDAKAPAALQA